MSDARMRWERLAESVTAELMPPYLTPAVERIVEEVRKIDPSAKKIGVELPDGLKKFATRISDKLEEFEVVISANSCYGGCDVDLSLLAKVDVLLHFAHTPVLDLKNVLHIPVFVDYNPKISVDFEERKLILASTVQYCHMLPEVKKWLESKGYEVELKRGSGRVFLPGQVLGCNYTAVRGEGDAIVFIGDGTFHATGVAVYSGKKVYRVDAKGNVEVISVKKEEFLKRRYFEVSKCVGMKSAGIIVSTKPGQNRLSLARMLVERVEREENLKADIIHTDEITPEKLGNLPYDFYVNTACPRISYDDCRNYNRPLLTPAEFLFLLEEIEEVFLDEL